MMEREKLGNRRKKGKDFYVGDHGVEGEIKPIFKINVAYELFANLLI